MSAPQGSLAEQVRALDDAAMREETSAAAMLGELGQAKERALLLASDIEAHHATASHLRAQALALLDAAGEKELDVAGRHYSISESPGRVALDDEATFKATNNRFVTEKPREPERKVDRVALGNALRAGEKVPGARLETTRKLTMRETHHA